MTVGTPTCFRLVRSMFEFGWLIGGSLPVRVSWRSHLIVLESQMSTSIRARYAEVVLVESSRTHFREPNTVSPLPHESELMASAEPAVLVLCCKVSPVWTGWREGVVSRDEALGSVSSFRCSLGPSAIEEHLAAVLRQ